MIASELGVDATLAKRAGLLHDIGKAMSHEIDGSHVQIGVDLARKYKESKDVIHAIEAHHGDVEPNTLVAMIVQAADAISAARPGAPRESGELHQAFAALEEIANSFDGIEKSLRHSGRTRNSHYGQARAGRRRRYALPLEGDREKNRVRAGIPRTDQNPPHPRDSRLRIREIIPPPARLSVCGKALRRAAVRGEPKSTVCRTASKGSAGRGCAAAGNVSPCAPLAQGPSQPTDLLPIFRFGKPSVVKRRAAPAKARAAVRRRVSNPYAHLRRQRCRRRFFLH